MQTAREPTLDEPDSPFKRNVLWSQQQMHVLGHHDKIV